MERIGENLESPKESLWKGKFLHNNLELPSKGCVNGAFNKEEIKSGRLFDLKMCYGIDSEGRKVFWTSVSALGTTKESEIYVIDGEDGLSEEEAYKKALQEGEQIFKEAEENYIKTGKRH